MNEKIRELIRSADVHIIPDESEYGHTIVGMEKFAELIVRETIDELLKQLWKYGCHGHKEVENPSFHYAIKRTKEHFGVE